jgi:outer membrane protein assembly factor BamC
MNILRIIVPLGALVFLSGCEILFGDEGWFPDHSNDYLEARKSKPLVFPDGMEPPNAGERYPIPDLAQTGTLPEKHQVPRVDPLADIENKGSVRIQSFQNRQWILVQRAPGQSWPLVLQYLLLNQIPLSSESADQGVIETDWLRITAPNASGQSAATETKPNERYRFTLQSGVQKNSTEITVLQRDANSEASDAYWPQQSSSRQREDNMVKLLAEYLAGSPEQGSYSLLAQGIGSASKVKITADTQGEPVIALELPFDRSWAALGLALEKANFKISDIDRSQGTYFANLPPRLPKGKKPSLIKRFFQAIIPGEKKPDPGPALKIIAQEEIDTVIIRVESDGGSALSASERAFMLRSIMGKIS